MSEPKIYYKRFTVKAPAIKPGQRVMRRVISIPVFREHGVTMLTPAAIDRIESSKMQMMLTRLNEAVAELYALFLKKHPNHKKVARTLFEKGMK